MAFWFGRKAAPADLRPFVPAWLTAWTSGGWRFQAPVEGVALRVRGSGEVACFRGGAWEIGMLRGSSVVVDGEQVVGAREGAIADPAAGSVADAEARTAISAVLSALRAHGLIEA